MNGKKHAPLPEWALTDLEVKEDARIIDIGCGGGANMNRLLKMFPKSTVTGFDHSELSLEMAKDYNYHAFVDKECFFAGGSVLQMPLAKEMFHVATAFETIYYWASLEVGIEEIFRILMPGGQILIANELDGLQNRDRDLEATTGIMRVYNIEEIELSLKEAGFININSRHDEERHFVCITARKP